VEVTTARKIDLQEILNLQKQCYLQEAKIYDNFQIPPLTQSLESINIDFENQVFLKIESEDKIIGSVRAYKDGATCKIGRLIVHPDFQNLGLGKQLMNAIEVHFKLTERFELFTGNKSTKNVSFYKKLGYEIYDNQKINEDLTLVYMEKLNTT